MNQSWTYGLTQTEVSNIADNASLLITQQAGTSIRSEARHFLRYDRRDVAINPTEGYLLAMRNRPGWSGWLGAVPEDDG